MKKKKQNEVRLERSLEGITYEKTGKKKQEKKKQKTQGSGMIYIFKRPS